MHCHGDFIGASDFLRFYPASLRRLGSGRLLRVLALEVRHAVQAEKQVLYCRLVPIVELNSRAQVQGPYGSVGVDFPPFQGFRNYSTFVGGSQDDAAFALSVAPIDRVTLAGRSFSPDFPTTNGTYDTTHNGRFDTFVSQLDLNKTGSAQLAYSTFLGGRDDDTPSSLSVDASGVVTVAGSTFSANLATTSDAYDTTHNGGSDVFISRLDPSKAGTAQLVYSTFLGGNASDIVWALSIDASGVATVTGETGSSNFPTTSGTYDTTYNGGFYDVFVSRLDMNVALWADVHQLSLKQAGSQKLTLNAGKQHAKRSYWIFGSVTGTRPGVNLGGVHISLAPDLYTDFTISFANSTSHKNTQGILDSTGTATASINLPSGLAPHTDFTVYHAYVVYDAAGRIYMASNAVPLALKN